MYYKKINYTTFEPRGMTALLDAIGAIIKTIKKRIKNTKRKSKPGNVIIVIIADGYENANEIFGRRDIFKKIRKGEEKDNWKFVFLAANQDAM